MNLEWLTLVLSKSDFIGLAIIVPAAVFAGFMTWWFRAVTRQSILAYFLEAVSIEAAAVLLFSLFNKTVFETIGENKLFLIIVAVNTISYGLRDVFERVRDPIASQHPRIK